MVHCQRIRAEQFVNLKRISIGYSQRGDPLVFGVKLRIYAAHNPTILQMVANLSMPSHYRFHFPTSMETHKAVKNRFRPAIFVGHPRFTRISFNFLLSSRVRGQEGPSTFIRIFFPSLFPVHANRPIIGVRSANKNTGERLCWQLRNKNSIDFFLIDLEVIRKSSFLRTIHHFSFI